MRVAADQRYGIAAGDTVLFLWATAPMLAGAGGDGGFRYAGYVPAHAQALQWESVTEGSVSLPRRSGCLYRCQ
jgi:hypothetical protein